jgi:hypothetical protein
MQNRITRFQERRGNEPQPISEVLTELLAHYETRFPGARIAVIKTPGFTEDQTCLFYPDGMVSRS